METKYQKNQIKQYLIKILKMSRKQFYDEDGNKCSTEKYVDILLSMPKEDVLKFKEKLDKQKQDELPK